MTDTQALIERLEALQEYLREPDHAENYSRGELLDWIDRRPTRIVPEIIAALREREGEAWRPVEIWRREGDLDVLYLGSIPVGRVSSSGGKGNKARWIFNLSLYNAFWCTEKTVDIARAALLRALSSWLRSATTPPTGSAAAPDGDER